HLREGWDPELSRPRNPASAGMTRKQEARRKAGFFIRSRPRQLPDPPVTGASVTPPTTVLLTTTSPEAVMSTVIDTGADVAATSWNVTDFVLAAASTDTPAVG